MAKMFYKADEASQILGISPDQLKQLVMDNKLREFRDGASVMFKVEQVDKLASERKGGTAAGTKAGSGAPIGLADSSMKLEPADSHASDVISLADSTAASLSKDDTVVTGAPQQVFKPGEVKPADTGAQTHIESVIDDQLALEGVGSGSGLLDLTRESDDTSLGAELLDEIYPSGSGDSKGESGIGSASGIFEQTPGGSKAGSSADIASPSGLEHAASTPSSPVTVTEVVEVSDPTSGAFGGLALASIFMSIICAVVALTFFQGFTPGWVQWVTSSMTNVLIFGVILLVASAVLAAFGWVVARPSH